MKLFMNIMDTLFNIILPTYFGIAQ